jgi:hypothetical protein
VNHGHGNPVGFMAATLKVKSEKPGVQSMSKRRRDSPFLFSGFSFLTFYFSLLLKGRLILDRFLIAS